MRAAALVILMPSDRTESPDGIGEGEEGEALPDLGAETGRSDAFIVSLPLHPEINRGARTRSSGHRLPNPAREGWVEGGKGER